MFHNSTKLLGLVLLAVFVSTTWGGSLVYDRGLPNANLNNAAGNDRSNVSWGNTGNDFFTGDNFTMTGTAYRIDTLRIWTADGSPDAAFNFLKNYSSIALYGSASGSALNPLESGNFTGGTATDNPNIVITPVTYEGGALYQGNSSTYLLFQVDFTNLNWLVQPGVAMQFGVEGITQDPDYYWVNHASNATLSGSPQQGADGKYLNFQMSDLNYVSTQDSNGNGWDKSSDINVQLFGESVPEPGSMFLLASGLIAVVAAARRKRA